MANTEYGSNLGRYYSMQGNDGVVTAVNIEEGLRICFPLLGSGDHRDALILLELYERYLGQKTPSKHAPTLEEKELQPRRGQLKALFEVSKFDERSIVERVCLVERWGVFIMFSCVV